MTEPVLAVEGISKRFGALVASDGISLAVAPGEIHALIGPNGAGKSTLIKQIAGTLAPDAGEIRFLNQEITGMEAAARARMGLGRSFQVSSVLPDYTVLQNVLLAVQGAAQTSFRLFRRALSHTDDVAAARNDIERVGLKGREAIPASDLAHGERRRLELAMALALKPKIFLLDEPMAGMGSEGAAEMTRLLGGLRTEAPILLVEHDMDAVFALADRITVLDYGRVIASGTVNQVRAHPEVRRAYLGHEDAT
jgi:branched-chain amino acid transport system ATP-binding protein